MNKVLQKKLLSYSTLATSLLAVEHGADAQVIYTKHNPPDTTILNSFHYRVSSWGSYQVDTTYLLDLNNDGIADFRFNLAFYSSYSTYVTLSTIRKNETIMITALSNNKIDADTAVSYGKLICGNKNWKNNQVLALYTHLNAGNVTHFTTRNFQSGAFRGDTDKYLPVELNVNGNNYYGWVRLTIGYWAGELTIKSYAYDATPGECITVGDTLAVTTPVLSSPNVNETSVWSSGKNIYVKLSNDNLLNSTVTIYNTCGQQVYSSQLIISQTNIELSNIPSGLYVVRINKEQSSIIKKIILD